MDVGHRPMRACASRPTNTGFAEERPLSPACITISDGSSSTTPLRPWQTTVLAVPKSIPKPRIAAPTLWLLNREFLFDDCS
jgi:hypothetical protein